MATTNLNAGEILATMNQFGVAYLLIGGMNFMLRHAPILTFDLDLWINDTNENRAKCELALASLDAEWGETDATWTPVAQKTAGWLSRQGVYALHSPHGAIDIFRAVDGLEDWASSFRNAVAETTPGGVEYYGISDADMLRCQLALETHFQKAARIQALRKTLKDLP
jgi:hypothetical protein